MKNNDCQPGLYLQDAYKAPTGKFILHTYLKGVLIDTFEENNLIVDGSKLIHAKLLGGTVSNNSVTQISFGTSGTAAATGNTTITGAFTKAIDTVTYPLSNQVSFNFSLSSSENNGMAIFEFGLLTAASALYARKVRSSVLNKDSDISLSGSWVISF